MLMVELVCWVRESEVASRSAEHPVNSAEVRLNGNDLVKMPVGHQDIAVGQDIQGVGVGPVFGLARILILTALPEKSPCGIGV